NLGHIPTLLNVPLPAQYPSGPSGFSFDNCLRNAHLVQAGMHLPDIFATGTTVVGIIFNGGIMLGTDTRTTKKNLIPSRRTRKIFRLQDNIYAAGAGVAQDLRELMELTESQMNLQFLNTNYRRVPVVCASQFVSQSLYRFRGRLGANVIIAGVDSSGAHLYCCTFDGTIDKLPFSAVGSGTLAAINVLELRWRAGMEENTAHDLVYDAVCAGVYDDLFSGSHVHVCIVRNDYSVHQEVNLLRDDEDTHSFPLCLKPGLTRVQKETVHMV
ncbi:hypothetical protein KR018_011627, partial [Drosophila ironensis]